MMEQLINLAIHFLPLIIFVGISIWYSKEKYKRMSSSNKMIFDTLTQGKKVNGGRELGGIRIQGRTVELTKEASLEISKRAFAQINHIKIKK